SAAAPRPNLAQRQPALPSAAPSAAARRSRLSLGTGGGGDHVAVVVLEDHAGGREDVGGGVLLGLGQADRVLGAQQVAAAGLGDQERRGGGDRREHGHVQGQHDPVAAGPRQQGRAQHPGQAAREDG